jgi:AhpD family alkylhydroperoxidase
MTMKERISFRDVPQELMTPMFSLSKALKNGELPEKLLVLVEYRVSQLNGCAFCLDMHYKDAIHLGETEQRLYSLPAWRECPWYSDAERAVLAYTDALTADADADDAVFAGLAAFFTPKQIVGLTFAIGLTNTWNRLNKGFRTLPGTYKVGMFG